MMQNIHNMITFGKYDGTYLENLPLYEYEMALILFNETNKSRAPKATQFDIQ